MIYLKQLNIDDCLKEYNFFKSMSVDDSFENEYKDVSYEEFISRCIPERLDASIGKNLKEGYVPDTYYFLWEDQQIIGLFRIRHYLNDFLKNGPGHIGYGVLPEYRNKGYASKGLSLAIEICKELLPKYEKYIYMSCDLSNIGSLKVMLNNQAYIDHKDDKSYFTRIRIR